MGKICSNFSWLQSFLLSFPTEMEITVFHRKSAIFCVPWDWVVWNIYHRFNVIHGNFCSFKCLLLGYQTFRALCCWPRYWLLSLDLTRLLQYVGWDALYSTMYICRCFNQHITSMCSVFFFFNYFNSFYVLWKGLLENFQVCPTSQMLFICDKTNGTLTPHLDKK